MAASIDPGLVLVLEGMKPRFQAHHSAAGCPLAPRFLPLFTGLPPVPAGDLPSLSGCPNTTLIPMYSTIYPSVSSLVMLKLFVELWVDLVMAIVRSSGEVRR